MRARWSMSASETTGAFRCAIAKYQRERQLEHEEAPAAPEEFRSNISFGDAQWAHATACTTLPTRMKPATGSTRSHWEATFPRKAGCNRACGQRQPRGDPHRHRTRTTLGRIPLRELPARGRREAARGLSVGDEIEALVHDSRYGSLLIISLSQCFGSDSPGRSTRLRTAQLPTPLMIAPQKEGATQSTLSPCTVT